MRKWKTVAPGDDGETIEEIVTEEEILRDFYPWWLEKMQELGRDNKISPERCIEDWVIVHWAEEIT